MTSQATRQANLLTECVSSLKLWKELINTHLEDEDKASELNQLEDIVKEFCSIDFEANKSRKACEQVIEYFSEDNNDQNVDVDQLYEENLAKDNESFTNHQQHRIWKEVIMGWADHDVEEVEQTTESQESTEYEEMHDSIYFSNVFTPPVDPISKMVITDPYRNKTCGHVYEYKFILQYIKSMKNKANCPYIGCNNRSITVSELVQDSETKNKILNYQKSHLQSSDD